MLIRKKQFPVFAILCATLFVVSCGGGGGGTTYTQPPVSAPVINSFSASAAAIASGTSVALSWAVSGAVSLQIAPAVGDVTGKTSVQVSPTQTTTYTLTATNSGGTTTRTVTVTVGSGPSITSFGASPTSVTSGNSAVLSWATTDATSLQITPGIGDVTGKTSVQVSPTQTTTYTLTAANTFGTASQNVTVTVGSAPAISSFSANPTVLTSGSSAVLTWAVTGASSLQIAPGIGDVTDKTTLQVSPNQTTTYTLTATNSFGTATQNVTVTVGTVPAISSFSADRLFVTPGTGVNLSWAASGADTVKLNGSVVNGTSTQVAPMATTTYTLSATNQFGSTTSTVTVTVGFPPILTAFEAVPPTVTAGESSTLMWNASSADKVTLNDGTSDIDVTGQTTYKVSPSVTTTYTLSATNRFGASLPVPITVTVTK